MKKVLALIVCIYSISCVNAAVDENNKYHQIVKRYADSHVFSGSVLVAKGDEVIFQQGYGMANESWNQANAVDTKFTLGSLTKSFTAHLVMQLVQSGDIALTDTIDKYLHYFPKKKAKKITINDLLGHRSGLPRQFVLQDWFTGRFDRLSDKVEYAKAIGELELLTPPGEQYAYTNLGYFLLGLIIENVTELTLEQALQRYIFTPLKMNDSGTLTNQKLIAKHADAYQISRNGGYEKPAFLNMTLFWAAANIYSTLSDIWAFEQSLYTNQLLTRENRTILLAKENRFSWTVEPWQLEEKSFNTINWGGELPGRSSFIVRFVNSKHTIIILSNNGLNETEKRRMARELATLAFFGNINIGKTPVSHFLTKALYDDNLKESIVQASKNIDDYVVHESSLITIGRQLMWRSSFDNSIAILRFNAELNEKSASAHYALSQVFEESGQLDLALKSAKDALALLPENNYLKQTVKRLMLANSGK